MTDKKQRPVTKRQGAEMPMESRGLPGNRAAPKHSAANLLGPFEAAANVDGLMRDVAAMPVPAAPVASVEQRSVQDAIDGTYQRVGPADASDWNEKPEVTPGPAPELVDLGDSSSAPFARLDLTKPEAAMAAGLEVAGPEVGAAVALPAVSAPTPQPPGLRLARRFDPREWVTVPGYWPREEARPRPPETVRAPEVNVEGKQQLARPATLGNILRDGFGRKVRAASGGFVKTRF